MRGMTGLVFCAVLLTAGVTRAQGPNGSMILAEGFATLNRYSGPLPGFFAS
jgi:hypothetical protein